MKRIFTALIASAALFPSAVEAGKFDWAVQEIRCMKANIFFEARGESFKGMLGVAQVTANRVLNKNYPNSVCGTVFQRMQFSWTHQLSHSRISAIMSGKVSKLNKLDREAYYLAENIARQAVDFKVQVLPKTVLHYHTKAVHPKWAAKMKRVAVIGDHIYYDSKGKK